MDYVFQITPYDSPELVRQVSDALERRTELRSRKKCPKMWKLTDRLCKKRASEGCLEKRRKRYRVYGMLLIMLGVVLFVPGAMDPKELLVPLLAGAAGILAGGLTLWSGRGRKRRTNAFDRAAKQFLQGLAAPPSAQIRFTGDGMTIAGKPAAVFADFNFAAETQDLFLLTWKEKITLLQKKDLIAGDPEGFAVFLRDRMEEKEMFYRACSPEGSAQK